MKMYASAEEYYIARCLQLAERGRATASPNPMVGAVVLDANGRKVGEGFHQQAGEAHAEIMALDAAGDQARGGTLYINLEPCNHTGKTPPCTDRIIQAGIEKVVCGTLDPNPLVAGSGRDRLQNARISVRHGFLEAECRKLNEAFFYAITGNRPFVALKLALTLDGKIAARSGQSQWLTGPLARQYVHHLRSGYDALLTTSETVFADNPQLTVRGLPGVQRQPVRVILDRRFRLDPRRYQVFDTTQAPTWVFTSSIDHDRHHAALARKRGAQVFEVEEAGGGLALNRILHHLGEQNLRSVMVEAGGRLAGALLKEKRLNKLYLFYAPRITADAMARCAFANGSLLDLAEASTLTVAHTRQLETDWVVEAYPTGV